MRHVIAFDLAVLAAGPLTGVARAFLTTLRAFADAGEERCVGLLPPHGADVAHDLPASVEVVASPGGTLRKQMAWPSLLRRLRADLLHVPIVAVPPRLPCPSVITVHDLPWRARSPLPRGDAPRLRHRLALHVSARAAGAMLVPSVATAHDLRRELPAALHAKIHVVPHGLPPLPPEPAGARTGDLLVLGDDRPRKNRARVAAAHALAVRADPRVPALRFVGPPDAFVSEAEKDALLRQSRGLLQLSLHEGFGMPVLEAMARGIPVLCSDHGALAELAAGGAALMADPRDVEAMARAIVRLCTETDLRTDLRRHGLHRAAMLTDTASAAGWRRAHRAALVPRAARAPA